MVAAETTEEMHAVSGTDERSERDNVRACVLLDLCVGLGGRKAGMSALSTVSAWAAYTATKRLGFGNVGSQTSNGSLIDHHWQIAISGRLQGCHQSRC